MSKYTDPMPVRENECGECGQVRPPLSAGIPHYCEPKRKVDPPSRAWSRDEEGKLIMRNGMQVHAEGHGSVRLVEVNQGPGLGVSRIADDNFVETDVYTDTLRTLTRGEQ